MWECQLFQRGGMNNLAHAHGHTQAHYSGSRRMDGIMEHANTTASGIHNLWSAGCSAGSRGNLVVDPARLIRVWLDQPKQ